MGRDFYVEAPAALGSKHGTGCTYHLRMEVKACIYL